MGRRGKTKSGQKKPARTTAVDARPPADVLEHVVTSALTAPEFKRSPRMRELLSYLVEETLTGRGDRLKGYNIGVDVFDKPADFDPNSDALVRVEVGRLRRILADHFATADSSISHAIEVPRGRYRVQFVPRIHLVTSGPTALLSRPTGPLVLVHPFLNHTPDALEDNVAVGLAAELVDELSRFRHMFAQRSSDAEESQTQDESHYSVSGTVALIKDQLRVVATLTDNTTSTVVWSREFRSPTSPGQLLATQREMAQLVASSVGHTYAPVGRDVLRANAARAPSSWEAWSVHAMWQSYQFHQPTPEQYMAIGARVNELLEQDPLSPALVAIRARMAIELAWVMHVPNIEEVMGNSRMQLLQAVGHDPNSADAWRELAVVEGVLDNHDASAAAFERALNLHPSDLQTLFAYVFYLGAALGKWHEAWPIARKVVDLGFMSPMVALYLCLHHIALGEAKAAAFEARKLSWDWYPMICARAVAYASAGDLDAAEAEVAALLKVHPDFESWGAGILRLWLKDEVLRSALDAGAEAAGLAVRLSD